MPAESDFHLTVDHAASLTADATSVLRAARADRLPESHRRLISAAIGKLEWAQDILFQARQDPWSEPSRAKSNQLALL